MNAPLHDDPRLTAYALGELDAHDRAEVEALLDRDPSARAAVDEIRSVSAALSAELAEESDAEAASPGLRPEQRAAILARPVARDTRGLRRPWTRAAVQLAVAAGVVLAAIWLLVDPPRLGRDDPAPGNGPVARHDAPRAAEGRELAVARDELQAAGRRDLPALAGRGRAEGGVDLAAAETSRVRSVADPSDVDDGRAAGEQPPHAFTISPMPPEGAGTSPMPPEGAGTTEPLPPTDPGGSVAPGPGVPDEPGPFTYDMGVGEAPAIAGAGGGQPTDEVMDQLRALGYLDLGGRDATSASGGVSKAAGYKRGERASTPSGNLGVLAGRGRKSRVVVESAAHDDPGWSRGGWSVPTPTVPGTEDYAEFHDNPFLDPLSDPLSTFSVDVDTGAYSNVRRFLNEGRLPPRDAVRIEELLNFFEWHDLPPAADAETPFAVHVESAAAPWAPEHRLVRVALKGRIVDDGARPPANLVFLLDVSGSMSSDDKLPLLKTCMGMLVDQLDERDRVAIVTYAGSSGVALPSTGAADKATIRAAIARLGAAGSTNGGAGIVDAYRIASEHRIEGGINRVILGTDGDFNVGVTQREELEKLIASSARSGVFLTVLGFGTGNLKDATVEMLADRGNGHYAYVDSLDEGRRVLVERFGGTLQTIAKDVKLQIEFNPARVGSYRLIGYENRVLAARDFNDDRKDAGEIGAGHSVVALYEIAPPGTSPAVGVDPLKYQQVPAQPRPEIVDSPELLTVKLRFKQPQADLSTMIELPFVDGGAGLDDASGEWRFSAAVAAFGLVLRDSPHMGGATMAMAAELGRAGRGPDERGYRAEFVRLAETAGALLGTAGRR